MSVYPRQNKRDDLRTLLNDRLIELLTKDENNALRLQRYETFWNFYKGKQWTWERNEEDPPTTLNFCKRIVNLHVDALMKGGFDIVILDDPDTKEDEKESRKFIKRKLEDNWRANRKDLWCVESGQMGAVTGDVFVRMSWEDTDILFDPFVRCDIIPSHYVFPEWKGDDKKKMLGCLILYPEIRDTPYRKKEAVIKGEYWTATSVTLYENGDELGKKDNPLGEIPIVHILNYPLAGEAYGLSDLEDLVELNAELNEKVTDISDIINYHGSPITILKGAKLTDLQKGVNRVWAIPADAEINNLQLEGDLAAAMNYVKFLKDMIMELTATPPGALGEGQAISNTSAVALAMQYLPLIDRRKVKILSYSVGLQLINRMVLKFYELKDSTFKKQMDIIKHGKYYTEIVFPPALPRDELVELEKIKAKLEMGLISRKRALEELGHGEGEIADILKEADADASAAALREIGASVSISSGKGPNEELQGEKVSAQAGATEQLEGK